MILTTHLSLLYIEPRNNPKLCEEIDRKFQWFKTIIEDGIKGTYIDESNMFVERSYYVGVHVCVCGAESATYDVLLPNRMITNTLAYHYLVYHTDEIPRADWDKLEQLKMYIDLNIIGDM